jgi:aldehyde oxidoreductase
MMKKITFIINGINRQFVVDENRVLIDLLRDDLHLTGTKQSCDRKGQCGACTVIVNGKAVRSCITKVASLEGADVVTVEGLGTPSNSHLLQDAFALSGAIQCGYCTPGMIMSTKALLDQNQNPNTDEIKGALARNLCRCTGYVKIIDAVKLAARFLRGETTPEEVRPDPSAGMIGVSHPRPSALLKACGVAEFSADIKVKNAAELAVARSTESHALIQSVDTSAAEMMPGVIGIMTAKDIQGTNRDSMISGDYSILCDDKVRSLGDPIAIVAAETRDQARAAAKAVRVEYDPLPVMMTPAEAVADDAVRIHAEWPNLCYRQPQIKGDPERALSEAAAVVEAEFSTQLNHQAPLEPENCAAWIEGEGETATIVVAGRSIMIHSHMAALQTALGWKNIRYEEAYSGGQFGGKVTISSEGITGAAALHFKRPMRYIPSLHESMLMTTKRHPLSMKIKIGADKEGKLLVYINELVVAKGAYHRLMGQVIIMRILRMLNGAYHIPHIRAVAELVYTNDASGGAARGAGPPQAIFGLESAVDMLAGKLGIDPLEFRLKNSLQPGQSLSTGALVEQWPFPELCEVIRPHYDRARKAAEAFSNDTIKRGVGVACHSFGIAQPGDKAIAAVECDPDDGVTIYAAAADPGEGNDSMLSQLAAHLLDLPLEKVRLCTRSTDQTVETGPAAGSRMTYMVGGALVDAVEKMKTAMAEAGARTYDALKKAGKPTRFTGTKAVEAVKPLDPETGQGPSFESQVHNIQMAEIEVNTETGQVKVIKMTTAVDPGTVINPQNLEGQLEGGMDQGVGYALREVYTHGQTKDWVTFKFPTMKTAFEVEVITPRETPRKRGTLGATGIGEMTMVSTAPAVLNAIYNACGVRIYDLPATPEKIREALAKRSRKE